MDLLCEERVSPDSDGPPRPALTHRAAASDPVLLRRRVLDNLLRTEERYAVTANYFGTLQTEITPHMRRIVAEWMLEVSAPGRMRMPHPHPRRSPFCSLAVVRPRVALTCCHRRCRGPRMLLPLPAGGGRLRSVLPPTPRWSPWCPILNVFPFVFQEDR